MILNPEQVTSCSNNRKSFVYNLSRNANSWGQILYASLWNLGNTKKGSPFTFLAFHKQRWQRKDELLMFSISSCEHVILAISTRAKVFGLTMLGLFYKECSSTGTCPGTVGSAHFMLLGERQTSHGIWDNPKYVPAVTLTFSRQILNANESIFIKRHSSSP